MDTCCEEGNRTSFRAALEARRRQLIDDLHRRVARIRENGADATLARELDEGEARDLDAALVDLATTTIHRIDRALERLDAGTYGVCTRCREPISAARLRALPFALCCRDCETARELQDAAPDLPARSRAWTRALVSGDMVLREEP